MPFVSYYSYAGSTSLSVFSPFYLASRIVKEREGENDGIVSVDSAKWGDFRGVLNVDHWDLIPKKKKTGWDAASFYQEHVGLLREQGF